MPQDESHRTIELTRHWARAYISNFLPAPCRVLIRCLAILEATFLFGEGFPPTYVGGEGMTGSGVGAATGMTGSGVGGTTGVTGSGVGGATGITGSAVVGATGMMGSGVGGATGITGSAVARGDGVAESVTTIGRHWMFGAERSKKKPRQRVEHAREKNGEDRGI